MKTWEKLRSEFASRYPWMVEHLPPWFDLESDSDNDYKKPYLENPNVRVFYPPFSNGEYLFTGTWHMVIFFDQEGNKTRAFREKHCHEEIFPAPTITAEQKIMFDNEHYALFVAPRGLYLYDRNDTYA